MNHHYLYGPEVMKAFTQAGLVPSATQSIDIRVTNDEFVEVTARFALSTQHLKEVCDGLPQP